jgi:hypothetical protein
MTSIGAAQHGSDDHARSGGAAGDALLGSILETSDDAIYGQDPSGKVTGWSRAAERWHRRADRRRRVRTGDPRRGHRSLAAGGGRRRPGRRPGPPALADITEPLERRAEDDPSLLVAAVRPVAGLIVKSPPDMARYLKSREM